MYYCIDHDSRTVESKSSSKTVLNQYVKENALTLAISIVSNPDELALKFSLLEMHYIYGFLNGNPPEFKNAKEASVYVFDTLEEHEDEFPTFTKALGKRLIKAAKKKYDEPKTRKKNVLNMLFNVGNNQPKDTTAIEIVSYLNNNFDSFSGNELIDNLLVDIIDIQHAFKQGYIIEVTE